MGQLQAAGLCLLISSLAHSGSGPQAPTASGSESFLAEAQSQNTAGQQLIQQQRFNEAKQAFRKAIALQPGYKDALENLALLDLMTRSDAEAETTAQTLLHKDSSNYNAHLVTGIVLLKQSRPKEALQHFQVLHAAANEDPLAIAGLIQCYVRLGETARASQVQQALEKLALDPRDALAAVQLFKGSPLHVYILPWLEQAHLSNSKFYPLYTALAAEYLDQQQVDKALACLRQALEIKPHDPSVLLALYEAEMQAGDRRGALIPLFEVKSLLPTDLVGLMTYGTICIQNRMFLDARSAFETAIGIAPNDPRAHYLLGVSLFGLDETAGAKSEFEKSLKIDPDFTDAWIGCGVINLAQGDVQIGFTNFQHALLLDHNSAAALYYIGQCLRRSGQPVAALHALRRAIQLSPNDARPHAELGAVLMLQKKFDDAEVELRRALTLDNSIASAHYHLGMLLRNKGDTRGSSVQLHLAEDLRESDARNAVIKLVGAAAESP